MLGASYIARMPSHTQGSNISDDTTEYMEKGEGREPDIYVKLHLRHLSFRSFSCTKCKQRAITIGQGSQQRAVSRS